jgi:hypothetical protein
VGRSAVFNAFWGAAWVWRCLAASGGDLAASGGIWRHLAVSGGIWRHLAASGGIWRHMSISSVFVGFSDLAVSGGIWR